jgi:hypothetical protein
MRAETESGICEACGQPFTSNRSTWMLRYSRYPAKRFCGERCRKAAEGRRYRARKRGDTLR